MSLALDRFKEGRLLEAEAACRQILAGDSGHADAWHLLGVLAAQTHRLGDAAEFLA